jgi:hypothetical protein
MECLTLERREDAAVMSVRAAMRLRPLPALVFMLMMLPLADCDDAMVDAGASREAAINDVYTEWRYGRHG